MSKVKTTAKVNAAIAAAAKKEHKPRSYGGIIGSGGKLVSAVDTIGIDYDPANPQLEKVNLDIILADIIAKNNLVKGCVNPYKAALIARDTAYKEMPVLKTSIINTLIASEGVKPEEILFARNLGKKVTGTRIKPIKNAPPPPTTTITTEVLLDETAIEAELDKIARRSVSHQRFEIRQDNISSLVVYATNLACYKTNVLELQAVTLKTYCDNLIVLNNNR